MMDNELKQLIQHISKYIFPQYFNADPAHEEIAVRGSLGVLLASFTEQATEVMESFVAELPTLKSLIESDVEAIRKNDPAVESEREIVLCYPGLKEMFYYRTAHLLHQLGVAVLPRFITETAHSLTGIDIHPAATIGDHFCIDHGTGIVIGATAVIGSGVTLYQGVTLGAKNFHHDANGLPIDEPRHPILEDHVTVYSNTSILGRVRIGEGTVVGGNVWLTHDVAPHSMVLQTTAKAETLRTYLSAREEKVLRYLDEHEIAYEVYHHPEGKTIEEAKQWWHNDGSVHCKNIFLRNHKGNQHYLVCFDCDQELDIHDLEQRLKAELMAQGFNSPGKLSFASAERMMKYLGLEPGSVSPFGLINDEEQHVILFLDENLLRADSLSFHPNDCRGTVVISQEMFARYLTEKGNTYRYMKLY